MDILVGKIDALALLFNGPLIDEYCHWALQNANAFAKVTAYLDAYTHASWLEHPGNWRWNW